MKKTASWILFIGEAQVRLYEAGLEGVFLKLSLNVLSEKSKLDEILKSSPLLPLRILIETSSLQFQSEPLPKLSLWDRLSYLKHKRELLDETITLKDVRYEKDTVNSSYMKPSPWGSGWIEGLPIPYEGIYFYPLEMMEYGVFLDQTLKDKAWMFVGSLEAGFLTQIIYDSGKILLSRLTKLPETLNATEVQNFISKDLQQTFSYLKKKGVLHVSSLEGFTSFQECPPENHLKPLSLDQDSLISFLGWWSSRKSSKWQFFPKNSQTYNPKTILYLVKSAGIAAILLGFTINAYLLQNLYEASEKLSALEMRLAQLNYEETHLREETENHDIPLMKHVLERYDQIQNQTLAPLSDLEAIATIMPENPELAILDFHWDVPQNQEGSILLLHVKVNEDENREIIADLFRDFKDSLEEKLGQKNINVLKAPFNRDAEGLFSGSTNQRDHHHSEEEALGLVEVKWP
ncbi:hypothetical protein Bealeia1_00222 [Candidatus Bealeia paramacronuclearis]|uniref:GspL cytoplasmic actin-ATPase-like domain-containing protein n=1 Tax=Candidatus Bealeia paramacronuclearis TaxID=1921001 RepID=A0ABZ2C0K1_9PROT|nr:hypothetical protein [Candidatus Bealeia paramacronuclearis]